MKARRSMTGLAAVGLLLSTIVVGSADSYTAYLPFTGRNARPDAIPTAAPPTLTPTPTASLPPTTAPTQTRTANPTPTDTATATPAATPSPTATPTLTTTATPAVTPTPVPPFSGSVQIYEVYNGMDGWNLPANTELVVTVTAPDGLQLGGISVRTDGSGYAPWTIFPFYIEEGD